MVYWLKEKLSLQLLLGFQRWDKRAKTILVLPKVAEQKVKQPNLRPHERMDCDDHREKISTVYLKCLICMCFPSFGRASWSNYLSRTHYIGLLLALILGNLSRPGSLTTQKIFVVPPCHPNF